MGLLLSAVGSGTMANLAALLAFAAPVSVAAENWVEVATTSDGSVIYVDRDSFERNGDAVILTERHDMRAVADSKYREIRYRVGYDCKRRTTWVTAATAVPRDGSAPRNYTWRPDEAPPQPIQDGAIGATLLGVACS